jgi:hypothetical protein
MRSKSRQWSAALALACLAAGTAACSGGAHPGGHPARARLGASARPASASSAAAAGQVPAATAARGALSARLAATAYRAVIVPVYPTAVRLADTLAYDKTGAAAQVPAFTSGLSKTLASLNGVTAFPGAANGSFTAYRAQSRALLATLARPAAVTASVSTRRQAALALYALAREIGQLGTDLSLVPATEAGGKH